MIIENMQTIYEVGKGYATQALDVIESLAVEDSKIEEGNLESVDQSVSDRQWLEASADEDDQIVRDPSDEGADADDTQAVTDQHHSTAQAAIPKPRRMTFE